MKTKGFIYLVSAFLVLLVASCEEDHIMTEYTGDAVGFVENYYYQSVKADFTYLEIPVTHSSINKSGSKAEVEITLSEGTSANIVSLNTTILDFDVADTIMLQLSIDHASIVEGVEYSISLTFTDAYLQHDFNGFEEVVIEFTKFKPTLITDFVGTWSGTEYYEAYDFTDNLSGIEIEQKDATTLIVKATDGDPGFLSAIFASWGEKFIASEGLEGDIELIIDLDNGDITLESGKYWGLSDANYAYWYVGSGSWIGGNTIKINFELHWDDADFTDGGDEYSEINFTLDTK